ncbi:MAG: DUF4249 domain-containing protein [Gemmatimonadales bacterium]|nr:DUF4249 domain-containing protein [Gemmatimonadales bacterium]
MRARHALALLLPLLIACERVVDPGIPAGPLRLVVEGGVELRPDNAAGAQSLRLTTTDAFASTTTPPPATNATVRVRDGQGGSWSYAGPDADGLYRTTGLVPVVGRTYTLEIGWNGDQYRAQETLLPVAPIDSLYFIWVEAGPFSGDSGIRAAIDYTDPAGRQDNYYWDLLVNGQRRLNTDPGNRFRLISEDRFYDGGRVTRYQPFDESVLEVGERVLVRQLALSAAGFRYHRALLEQQSQGGGSPFSVPPASVRGNVANLTRPEAPALGWFRASQVAERAATVPRVR